MRGYFDCARGQGKVGTAKETERYPTYFPVGRTAPIVESGQDRGLLYCPYAQHALAVQERPSACSRLHRSLLE